MPGSKRRALKKLLSPTSSPATGASSPSADLTPVASASSIASNPNNYMSDEALQQDLEVEEMMDRERSIGSGMNHVRDGVDLSPGGASTGSVPPPPPPKLGSGHDLNGHRPPPPPPPHAAAMVPPQQMTAEQLMFGNGGNGGGGGGGGGGGKKKSSKQRFAERQVGSVGARRDLS